MNVLVVALAQSFQQHYGDLFTGMQIVGTQYFYDLRSNDFVLIADQFLNELIVDEYLLLLLSKAELIVEVELK